MSTSELETQINRFKVNEERLNTFVNVDGFYTTSSGVQVPTLLNVSKRIEASVENVSLAEQSASIEIARQTDLVKAASTSAQEEFLNEDSKINTLAKNTIADWQTAITTITQTEGVPALAVSTANNETQQSINDSVGAKWYAKGGGYPINYRVMLDNGDIVKSTDPNNTNDPNVNMTGWIKTGNLIVENTAAEMVAKNLKNGDVVKTLGYNNVFDSGGALYVISSTATDYSIPLNNGSHAIFNDTFDIRKFGILDNPNVDQDINLLRMTNYADTREYEIDFHNYAIRVPATALFTTDQGDTVRGIGFNKVHYLKNLNLKNNDTITQAAGLCCVGFYPKSEADCSGVFKISGFKCDAQLTNYTGNNGAFDGFLLGFIAYPHPDWSYLMWNVENLPTMPIEFHFENIHFSTPAMSYNMAIANWKSRKIVLKNISGDYLGLYAHAFAHIADVSKVNVVYRKDLHTTMIPARDLVTSAIHQEPELGTTGTAYVQSIKLADMHVVDSDGNRGLAYWHWSHGALTINEFTAKDIHGYVSLTKAYAMGGKIGTLVADNVSGVDVVHNVDTMRLSRVQIKPYQRIKLRPSILGTIHTLTAAHVKNLVIADSYIEGKLCAAYDEGTRVDNLIMRNCTFDSTDYFVTLAPAMNVIIERVDTKTSERFLYARMPKLTIDGLQSYAIDVTNFIKDDYADASYAWDVSNLQSKATSGFVLNGDATIDIRHSVFNSKLEVAVLPTAKVSVSNTTVKPETVNVGAVTVLSKGSYSASFAMPFVKLGDVLSYSSQVDLLGCTLNVYVKSNGNCTLNVYNGTNESLTFNPLAIYVWLKQSL